MNEFMDLSSISLLLKFGINTTKNNYYHISSTINLELGIIDAFEFNLEVYIVVQDSYCKIYGLIDDAAIFSPVQKYNDITTKGLKSEFTFETYAENDPNREDGVGGYFDFRITDIRRLSTTRYYQWRTTSKNLLDPTNLVKYLLGNMLYMDDWIIERIGGVSLSSDEQKPAGDFTKTFTSTGFNYNESQKKWSVGLNLDVLTGVEALKDLEINIYGTSAEKLGRLQGKLNIEAMKIGSLKLTIGINFDFTLENTALSVADWSSAIQSKFSTIRGKSFNSSLLNNPDQYLEYK